MNSPRTGKWAIIAVDPSGKECAMAFYETLSEANREVREYEMQSPAHLELDWFVRWEGPPPK